MPLSDLDSLIDPKRDALTLDTTTHGYAKTGTGLDFLVETVLKNPGLNQYLPRDEIVKGADAAAGMNALIIKAIKATGSANNGKIDAADVRVIADWLKANEKSAWKLHHGNDENGKETGFHYVQGDGDGLVLFGDAAVDQVADGLYHLGFGHNGRHLINEDGNANVDVDRVAFWLNELLADDLAKAAASADAMNALLIEGIKALGLANNGAFTAADMRELGAWISKNHLAEFKALHGRGENGINQIDMKSGDVRLFGDGVADTIATDLYDIAFGTDHGHTKNIDGKGSSSLNEIAHWLTELLSDDLANGSLANANVETQPAGTTGTALDSLLPGILNDPRLNENMKTSDIAKLARSVDAMNAIVIEGMRETGVGEDGVITALEINVLSKWIADNRKADWVNLRGDDDKDTGLMGLKWEGGTVQVAGVNLFNEFGPALYSWLSGCGQFEQCAGLSRPRAGQLA